MQAVKHKLLIVAVLLFMVPHVASAVGLGRINVLSALGQPFKAEIDLVNVQKQDQASLTAKLASPENYQKAKLQYNAALTSLRLSIDKRPNGTPFIRAFSTRAVAEPFLDLLIELQWSGGRIVREYSALLDPPGFEAPAPVAAASAPVSEPIMRPAPAVSERSAATARESVATASAASTGASEYAVKPGDTMGRIAASVKPDGVSLEQALIGIFRSNPQAFINKNVNLVRSGKILRVPEKEQLMAIPQADAARELRVQIENWNTYRQKLADTAAPAPESKPVTSGKITARVEDKSSTDGAKDVVRLSKGDASGSAANGKDGKPAGADKVRALEEELVARDKALAEANDRVKQLEKTLQDMQKLVDLKGGVPAPVASDAKDEALKDVAKAEPPKIEPLKPADKVAAAAVDNAPVMAPESTAEAPKIAKAPAKPTPKAKAKAPPPPPPKPEPGMLDMVSDNIVPIGGGALLVGLGAFWALRRRNKSDTAADDESTSIAPEIKSEPTVAEPVNDAGAASAATVAAVAVAPPIASAAVSSEAVDPMEEAQVYLDHGRDAQAEDILKEAMKKDPQREDFQLKLLEVYATRNDKSSFGSLATRFNALTGGHGDNWTRVAAMGYALDPDNALYDVGKDVVVDIAAGAGSTDVPNLDFDIGDDSGRSADSGSTTDIELDAGPGESDLEKTIVVNRDDVTSAHSADAKPVADESGALDINLELPSLDTLEVPAETAPAPKAAPAADANMDFKVDFGELDLKIDDNAVAVDAGDVKDPHWDDVQQKFDLARAYQEMGDKEGAKEILEEVMREGSDQQKADAEKMIAALA